MSKNIIYIQTYKSPVGDMILGAYDNVLCMANWKYGKTKERIDRKLENALNSNYVEAYSEAIEEAKQQLDEYFTGSRIHFDIPLLMVGTTFQKSVWHALLQIPYGKTASYLEQAKQIGNEKAVRAVASANGTNAISIFIPCHRIIGNNGTLTGYAGGLDIKEKLLELEKSVMKKENT